MRFRELYLKRERSGKVLRLGTWLVHVLEVMQGFRVKDMRDDKTFKCIVNVIWIEVPRRGASFLEIADELLRLGAILGSL